MLTSLMWSNKEVIRGFGRAKYNLSSILNLVDASRGFWHCYCPKLTTVHKDFGPKLDSHMYQIPAVCRWFNCRPIRRHLIVPDKHLKCKM